MFNELHRLGECKRHNHPDLETVVRICLATGARWSEAESLRKSQLTKYKITYINTKGRKNRTVPISKELYEALPDDKKGRLFSDCYGALRSALERTGIELPAGQLTHVLRHTFASHFMMNGGNIPGLAARTRPYRYQNDDAICALCTRPFRRCSKIKSFIKNTINIIWSTAWLTYEIWKN